MKYPTKSIMIGRKPREKEGEFKTATIALFEENNPHKAGGVPTKVLDFPNTEKIRIRDLVNISYYLEGNDIVINDLEEVDIEVEGTLIYVRGKQVLE